MPKAREGGEVEVGVILCSCDSGSSFPPIVRLHWASIILPFFDNAKISYKTTMDAKLNYKFLKHIFTDFFRFFEPFAARLDSKSAN